MAEPSAGSGRPVSGVGFIGVGQLAEHLVTGICSADSPPAVVLSPRSESRSRSLASRFSLPVAESNQAVADAAGIVIVSVAPGDVVEVVKNIRFRAGQLVISVAAGLPLAPVAAAAAPARAVRAMPVTSAMVRQSATACYPRDEAAAVLFQLVGTVHPFDTEAEFEIAMVIATYYGWVYALLSEASAWLEEQGLDAAETKPLVAQMTRGACAMCLEGGRDMTIEAREIGRPGTYTGLGLDLLDRMDALSAWRETLDAVLAATRRGRPD